MPGHRKHDPHAYLKGKPAPYMGPKQKVKIMSQWTKKIPKKNGLFWFWTTRLAGIPTIVVVQDGEMAPLQTFDQMKKITYVTKQCPDYKFGPEVKPPSVRNLNKKASC